MITTVTMPETKCPACGTELNAATGGPGKPSHGDVSICIECTTVSIFEEDLQLRQMTDEEWKALEPEVIDSIIDYQLILKENKKIVEK